MLDTELYAMILGIRRPWRVVRVELDQARARVDVWAEHEPGWQVWRESSLASRAIGPFQDPGGETGAGMKAPRDVSKLP